jgi:hypothetical protein
MTKTYRKFLMYCARLEDQGDFIPERHDRCCRTAPQQEHFDALWHQVAVEQYGRMADAQQEEKP